MLEAKRARLRDVLRECGSVCIGYSGGVDSAFLAAAAVADLGRDKVLAVTGLSPAVPARQREIARACARDHDIPHLEIQTWELADENYAANPANRCYYCKTELWSRLVPLARARDLRVVCDGSNADDVSDYRPGMQAAREHGVRSPLIEAGLTKQDIRALSREMGLQTWDMPAAPCLSSRLPYGVAVTPERLAQVEHAEDFMRRLGFRDFRVRHHDSAARIEVAPAELDTALQQHARISAELRAIGFRRVLLDVDGYRRGALNEVLTLTQLSRRPNAAR